MPRKTPQPSVTDPAQVAPGQSATGPQQSVSADDIIDQLGLSDNSKLIADLQAKRGGRKLLSIALNEQNPPAFLNSRLISPLVDQLRAIGKVDSLDVHLRSVGGVAEIPWRVISVLRQHTKHLAVLVSNMALSGACHIAIGADELVMTPYAILGPVDPTRQHALLPQNKDGDPVPTSVQDLKHCVEFIRAQLGKADDKEGLAQIISDLFKHVHPLAIGAIEQSFELSRLITRKALETRHSPSIKKKQIDIIVDQLSGNYYSHAFPISRTDVASDLGLPVTSPDDELCQAMLDLDHIHSGLFKNILEAQTQSDAKRFRIGAVLESEKRQWVLLERLNEKNELESQDWRLRS